MDVANSSVRGSFVDLPSELFQMLSCVGPYLYRDTLLLQKVYFIFIFIFIFIFNSDVMITVFFIFFLLFELIVIAHLLYFMNRYVEY